MTEDKEIAGKIERKKGYMYWVDAEGNICGRKVGLAVPLKKKEGSKTEDSTEDKSEDEEEDELTTNNANEIALQASTAKKIVPMKKAEVIQENFFQPAVNKTVKRREDELKPKEKVFDFLKSKSPKDYWEIKEIADAIKETKTEVVYALQLLGEEFLVLDYDNTRQYWRYNFEGLKRKVFKLKEKKESKQDV